MKDTDTIGKGEEQKPDTPQRAHTLEKIVGHLKSQGITDPQELTKRIHAASLLAYVDALYKVVRSEVFLYSTLIALHSDGTFI